MKNKKINFAVVGCGRIGQQHIDLIVNNSMCNLVALVDNKDKKLLNIKYNNIPLFNNLDNFFNANLDVDVMIIATPNGMHASHAIRCLEKNKHVVVEKPLALNKVSGENIIFQSLKSKKNVFIVMQNHHSSSLQRIKKIIEEKILGEIYIVQINCFWNRNEKYYTNHPWHGKKDLDGGTLFTQFSHFIDMIYWLFGDINNVVSKLYNFNHKKIIEFEDSGIVTFDFCSGGSGVLNYSTSVWEKNLESSMKIIAENGSVVIEGQYMEKIKYCNINNYEIPKSLLNNSSEVYDSNKMNVQNHAYVIENIIDVLNNKKENKTNVLEGLKVIEIIEKIYTKNYKRYD